MKILSALALVAMPFAAMAAPAPLVQVSAHLKAVDTMTAAFVQTDRNGKALSGTLVLKKPGRVRFQYQKGVPLLVVGDGRALTMIDYQVRQVQRWPIGDTPLSVLLNPDKDLSRVAQVVPGDDPAQLFVRSRDPKHPEYGTITLAFRHVAGAPGGLMLEGWTVLDAQNNRSAVQLSNQRFNVAVADSNFRYADPRSRMGAK